MQGNIHSIETMGLLDGPGIRVVVFLQGCPLRCLFCHNPETWDKEEKTLMTPEELVAFVLKYKNYFNENGGVTFSGGEPLMQSKFLLESLKLCKENSINTCLDTSGFGNDNIDEILEYTDLIIFDIKDVDDKGYLKMTGQDISDSLNFLKLCQKKNKKLWLRQVIIPTINDTEEYILRLKQFVSSINNVEKIELLPYHLLGVSKYDKLNMPYRLNGIDSMNKKRCEELYNVLISD
jgi:pyruvate formate lyase activating enzyme